MTLPYVKSGHPGTLSCKSGITTLLKREIWRGDIESSESDIPNFRLIFSSILFHISCRDHCSLEESKFSSQKSITKSPFTAFLREYANFFINPKRYNLPPISVTTLIRWDLRKVPRAYHGHISPIQAYFSSGWLPQRKQTLFFLLHWLRY